MRSPGISGRSRGAGAEPVGVAGGGGRGRTRTGSGPGQAGPEQPVGDPPQRRRLQLVPQRAAAQQRVGAEQALDDGQRTGGVAVVQACADVDEAVRMTVRLVDGPQAGQRRAGQRDQQFLAADLGRVVVQRDQHPVDQADPVLGAPALDEARLPCAGPRVAGRTGPAGGPVRVPRRPAGAAGRPRSARCGAVPGRAAPRSPRRAGPAARRRRPSSGAAVIRSAGGPDAPSLSATRSRTSRCRAPSRTVTVPPSDRPSARSSIPASAAHRSTAQPVPCGTSPQRIRVQHGRPSAGGRSAPDRTRSSPVLRASHRWRCRSRRNRRLGRGCGWRHGAGLGAGSVPQREADPLTGVRPGRRCPGHEVHRRLPPSRPAGVVPGQGDGQTRAQQPVGSDPRHVPAQQVRSQMAEIGADPGGELPAVGTSHGAQIEIDVDACGGARPGPVARQHGGRSQSRSWTAARRTRARAARRKGGNPRSRSE